jgi:Holliday junction resolvase RusA-like endonuclease
MGPVRFEVHATPAPQGSKRIVPTAAGPRPVESSKHVRSFRSAVAEAAAEAFAGKAPLPGAISLRVVLWNRRPATHWRTGKRAGELRPSAPTWKTSAPDLDKVIRAVADALTGTAYVNDGQIAHISAVDRYAPVGYAPRVVILVRELLDE